MDVRTGEDGFRTLRFETTSLLCGDNHDGVENASTPQVGGSGHRSISQGETRNVPSFLDSCMLGHMKATKHVHILP